jgi:hypothetical protein
MRDIDVIDSNFSYWSRYGAEGRPPSSARIDELLEEREILTQSTHRGRRAAAPWPCGLFTPFDPEDKRPDN